MDLTFITQHYIPVVLVACLVVGTIEKLSKEINRSEAVLRRMKGSRIISQDVYKRQATFLLFLVLL